MKVFGFLLLFVPAFALLGGCASAPAPDPQAMAMEQQLRVDSSHALEAAYRAMKDATTLGWQSEAANQLLKQAEDDFAKGVYQRAMESAKRVESLALTGENAQYIRMADSALQGLKNLTRLSRSQQQSLLDIEKTVRTGNGKAAYEKARRMLAELEAAQIAYLVSKGDSLWKISGLDEIYANPFLWPLIFKANRDQIKDADLIYPGQKLNIDQHPNRSSVDAAVEHAKHRGAWSVGAEEASDKTYLDSQ